MNGQHKTGHGDAILLVSDVQDNGDGLGRLYFNCRVKLFQELR